MTVPPRSLTRPALLVGCLGLLLPAIAIAQTYPPTGVHDNAKMFSKEAVEKADEKIDAIKRDYKKDVCIETFAKLLPEMVKEYEAAVKNDEKNKFWADLAEKRYDKHDVKGIYLLIVKEPARYEFAVGRLERAKAFTPDDRKKAEKILEKRLKAKEFDEGLLAVVNDIDLTLNKTVGRTRSSSTSTTSVPTSTKSSTGGIPSIGIFSGIGGLICLGLIAALALWVVVGVFRALTGAGSRPVDRAPYGGQAGYGGQGGYGPQGGGYAPQGGGGGGFMKSMLGGMLGAAGGMFLYDRFFGGGHSSMGGMGGGGMTPTAYGGPAPVEPDDRVGDTGGGDWGDQGGDAARGGGGDWGAQDDGGGGAFGGDDGGGGSFGGDDGGGGSFGGGDAGGGDW